MSTSSRLLLFIRGWQTTIPITPKNTPKQALTHLDMAKRTDIQWTTVDFEVSTTRGTERSWERWEGGTQSDTREKRERVANQWAKKTVSHVCSKSVFVSRTGYHTGSISLQSVGRLRFPSLSKHVFQRITVKFYPSSNVFSVIWMTTAYRKKKVTGRKTKKSGLNILDCTLRLQLYLQDLCLHKFCRPRR